MNRFRSKQMFWFPIRTKGARTPFFCVHPVGGKRTLLCGHGLSITRSAVFTGYSLPGSRAARSFERLRRWPIITRIPSDPSRRTGPTTWADGPWAASLPLKWRAVSKPWARFVERLAMFDSWAPAADLGEFALDDRARFELFTRDLGAPTPEFPDIDNTQDPDAAHERNEHLLRELVKSGSLPPGFGLRTLRLSFEVFQANLDAILTFRPHPLQQDIRLFHAEDHDQTAGLPKKHGWDALVLGRLECVNVQGNHFSHAPPAQCQ